MKFVRRTLAKDVMLEGVGVHTGAPAVVRLRGAGAAEGLVLCRTDTPHGAFGRLGPQHAVASPLCTLLKNDHGVTVSTVEHLMAALCGLGVTDVRIEVDGPELPIGDGSAQPWVDALDAAGLVILDGGIDPLVVTEERVVEEGARRLVAVPAERFEVEVEVDFGHPMIGVQRLAGVVTEDWFRREIARARTFTLEREVRALQAAGFGKGGSLSNAVVFGDNGQVLNPEGLRWPDEPVRHKVLDVLGDFYLAGRPILGKLQLRAPGHSANNALLRKMTVMV